MTTLTMPQQMFAPTTKKRAEPLTENGFTVAEERRILQAWKDIKSGKAEIISSEEMRRQIEMESRL